MRDAGSHILTALHKMLRKQYMCTCAKLHHVCRAEAVHSADGIATHKK